MEESRWSTEELIPVVAQLTNLYTGCDHTSVTYERAQALMEAVLYHIAECENNDSKTLILRDMTPMEMDALGQELIIRKAKKLGFLYNMKMTEFHSYQMRCLYETMKKGIPVFLKLYDAKFAPQDTILTLDYPILKDLGESSGIDRVYEYVKCVFLEQKFLGKFSVEYVETVLEYYDSDYTQLIENVCDIVLPNVLGHILIQKPMQYPRFSEKERARLQEILEGKSNDELENGLHKVLKQMIELFYSNDKALLEYLSEDLSNLTIRIQNAIKHQCMEQLFM